MFEAGARREAEASRIISLLPSATEIVCALGASQNIVGISAPAEATARR